jgi:hypothetical protein
MKNTSELIDEFVAHVDPAGEISRKVESTPWVDALALQYIIAWAKDNFHGRKLKLVLYAPVARVELRS